MKRYLAFWVELLRLTSRMMPGLTALMFALLSLDAVLVVAVGVLLAFTVDSSLHGATQAAVFGALGAAAAYGATSVSGGLMGSLRGLLVERVGLTTLHDEIHREIATIEGMEHLESREYLDRVTVVRGAAWGLADGLWSAITTAFNVAKLAISMCVLGGINPFLLGLLFFAAAPLWFGQRGQRIVRAAETDSAEQYRLQDHLFNLATSPTEGKEIRVAGAGQTIARHQQAAWQAATRARVRARLQAAGWKFAGWFLFTTAFVASLALVAYETGRGTGSVGDIVLTITIAANLQQSVQFAVSRAAETAGAGRLIDPYLWLRDYSAHKRAMRRATPLTPPDRLVDGIRLENVSYTYPSTTKPALDDVSVSIPAGSIVAIVGEYGSGKTTVAKLLAKFYQPDAGRILVDGADLADIDTPAWRARMACAFQDFGRFNVKAGETVELGDVTFLDDEARVGEALRFADAEFLYALKPDGLKTQLGRKFGGVELSEGQWQKTALARASMRTHPLVFILDEPTASLDAPSENAIFKRYMERARTLGRTTGATTIIVSHRFSTVSGVDLILVLHEGKLIEVGTHAELLARDDQYASLYRIQETAYTAGPGLAPAAPTD